MNRSPFPDTVQAEDRAPMGEASAAPGSIRAVIAHPFGGKIIMTGFPGLEIGFDGQAVFQPDSCHDTLAGLRAHGGDSLVVLVERDELETPGFDLLEKTAAELDIALQYHAIVDYSVPSPTMAQAWRARRVDRLAALRAGRTLAFSCQYGAGRSGLMASWCLMEGGLSARAAMALVRSHFSEAVESEAQEAWLAELEADLGT